MNKLEDHIKRTLHEREITPSKNAWKKIEKGINKSDQRNSNNLKWYGIAASIALLLTISFYVLNSKTNVAAEIVETPVEEQKEVKQDAPKHLQPPQQENSVAVAVKEIKEEIVIEANDKVLAVLETEKESDITKQPKQPKSILQDQNDLIAMKVEEVFVAVQQLEIAENQVTDAEVDSLLRAAQKEILLTNYFQKDATGTDAMALLMEVEEELDESFRDQLFDKLKQGYFKLRTAVADRNK